MARTKVRVWRGVREDEVYPVYSLVEGRDAAFTPAELNHIERVTSQYEAVQAFIIERYDSMEATKARVAAEKAAAEAEARQRWKKALVGVEAQKTHPPGYNPFVEFSKSLEGKAELPSPKKSKKRKRPARRKS